MLNKNNLNLQYNERRLILLALIKTNYNIEEAYKINAPSDMTLNSYRRRVNRYGLSFKELKKMQDNLVV